MLLNECPQCFWVGLRPNCPALETSITLSLKLCSVLKGQRKKTTRAVRRENDVRKKLLARPSDVPVDDFCPTAFMASCHVVSPPSIVLSRGDCRGWNGPGMLRLWWSPSGPVNRGKSDHNVRSHGTFCSPMGRPSFGCCTLVAGLLQEMLYL